jgi:surface polysaccharide O-acyltransferase-like enzyme
MNRPMLKLIGIIIVAMPVILFVRALFMGSKRREQAVSNFRRQVDYMVWIVLLLIGLVLVFSVVKLILDLGTTAPR